MDKDKKTLLISFLVLVVVVIIVASIGGITGEVTKSGKASVTKIWVSSSANVVKEDMPTIKAGEMLYTTIETGSQGSKSNIQVIEKTANNIDRRRSIFKMKGCGDTKCMSNKVYSVSYAISASWSGKYCVSTLDIGTDKDVQVCFNVVK